MPQLNRISALVKKLFVCVICCLVLGPATSYAGLPACFRALTTTKTDGKIPGKVLFAFESTIDNFPTNYYFAVVDLGKDKPAEERYRLFEGYLGELKSVVIGEVKASGRHLRMQSMPIAQINGVEDLPPPKTVEEAVNRRMRIYRATKHYVYSAPSIFGKQLLHVWNSGSAEFGGGGSRAYTKGNFIEDVHSHAILKELESFFDPANPFAGLLKVTY